MKKMRLPLLVALGVAVLGIIFGTFFDLQISQAIASPSNKFALFISAIGPTVGFASVAAMGGGFIALAIHGKYHIALKILFYVLAACCFAVSIIYPKGEYFGVNGFYGAAPEWVAYFIVVPLEAAAMVGGYFLFKDCQNKNMWIVFCVIIATLLIALLATIPTIKDHMHRPRFRFLLEVNNMDLFHRWYEPCGEYKDLIALTGTHKDNFKSFPSGHTAEASILFVTFTFFPLAHKKYEKLAMPLFGFAAFWVALIALARILAAAHFLSDVSWGATIALTLLIVANEVVMRVKTLQLAD